MSNKLIIAWEENPRGSGPVVVKSKQKIVMVVDYPFDGLDNDEVAEEAVRMWI